MNRRAWRDEPMMPSLQPASTLPAGKKVFQEHLKVRVNRLIFFCSPTYSISRLLTNNWCHKIKNKFWYYSVYGIEFNPLIPSHSLHRNLRRLSHLQEGDWQVLQTDSEGTGDKRGPHHHRRLHVPFLFKPGLAQTGANGSHFHCQKSCGARPGARQEPHLSGCGSHLHGLPGLSREEDPERWAIVL